MQNHRTSSNRRRHNRAEETFEHLAETWRDYGHVAAVIGGVCLTERLHVRFTTWEAFERAIQEVKNNYGDKFIHGEIVVEIR